MNQRPVRTPPTRSRLASAARGALRRLVRDERGIGIVTALSLAVIVFTAGATWVNVAVHQVESSSHEKKREQALHAAEAGLGYAIGHLSGDLHYSGTSGTVAMADGTGEFELTVDPLDPNNPDDLDRYIVSKGYASSKGATRGAERQLEQQVLLEPNDGFEYALFASPGGVIGQNNSNITGDVYSAGDVTLANFAKVKGDITARGSVATSNQNLVTGDIHALNSVDSQDSQTDIQGSIYSADGDVIVGSQVEEHVQAAGTVTVESQASVGGTIQEHSPPPEPLEQSQPSFTWDADNYPTAYSWTSASGFMSHWESNLDGFQDAHRVHGGDDSSNKITLDKKWTLTGDTTIVTNGPITLSRDVVNGTDGDVTLAIVTNSARDPALSFTNNVTIPSDVKILLFAPDGVIDFSQLKDFHGVVYGDTIRLSQNYTLAYDPPDVPGFGWDAASSVHYEVKQKTLREVPFGS